MIVSSPIYLEHLTGLGHPERPERCKAIVSTLQKNQLMTKQNTLVPREATDEEILLCHSERYLKIVKQECEQIKVQGLPDDGSVMLLTGDVQICSKSIQVARYAVGGALVGIDALMKEVAKTVFCSIRPPGHHANSDIGMGFCLFNNAAIAARYAQKVYGIKRVAIIDWDVHHGNGTQDIFEEDPSVFYFSTHRFGHFYPGTGSEEETGIKAGKGTILNCPIRLEDGSPREAILKAFKNKLIPVMDQFQPGLVILSAGFDAHENDPLGGFDLTDQDFVELTQIVKGIAQKHAKGRILSVLEGGYDLEGLASAVSAHVAILKHC